MQTCILQARQQQLKVYTCADKISAQAISEIMEHTVPVFL